jgi:hypothetical protein
MITWRKSSFSSNGNACVEVAWRKSSFSGTNGGCVEVAHAPAAVLVRDSKNAGGPVLSLSERGWHALVARLTADA